MSRTIDYSINISVGTEWTSLRLYTVKVCSIKRGGHEPTFYLVKDDWSAVTDFYFDEIIDFLYDRASRRIAFNAYTSCYSLSHCQYYVNELT